jgi:hypothetical protein
MAGHGKNNFYPFLVVTMPPWLTALLVLVLISGLGAYMVYREGFETASTKCKNTFNTCVSACSPTNGACLTTCGEARTKCLSDAVAAATIINTDELNRPYTNANMAWAASLGSGMLGNRSNSNMTWSNSAGSSTSISRYNTSNISTVYRPTGWDSTISSPRSPSSITQQPTTIQTPTTQTPSSAWDGNRDRYTTGWNYPTFDLQDAYSYDANAPSESSYDAYVKRWKPHETPTQQAPGLKANAPTDAGTQADQLKDQLPSLQQNIRDDIYVTDDIVPDSIRGLIREDVKDTIDALFRNQYEIQYS